MAYYNISQAISLRGKTLSQLGYECTKSQESIVVDFKLSLEIASKEHQFGNVPDHALTLMQFGRFKGPWNFITKTEWKEIKHSERKYYYDQKHYFENPLNYKS